MNRWGYLAGAVIIVAATLITILVGPSGLYYDDAACLYDGKFILSNPASIFSFRAPVDLRDDPKFERILWVYYRPVERIAWAFVFLILGPSTLGIGFLQKLLFLASLYLIYRIGRLLSGKTAGWIAVIMLIGTPLLYGLLLWHAWLATQLGLLFVLGGIYFTLWGLMNNRLPLVAGGVLLGVIAGFCRESNMYIYFGVIFPFVMECAAAKNKNRDNHLGLGCVCISFILCCLFYLYLIFKSPIYSSVGLELHKPGLDNFVPNIIFYGGEILSRWNIFFIAVCLCLLFIYKSRLQLTGLVWALVALIPLLFSHFIAKTYLFNFFIGFSLFCAGSLSLFLKQLKERWTQLCLASPRNLFLKKDLVLAPALIITAGSLLFSAFKTLQEVPALSLTSRNNRILRQSRVDYIRGVEKNAEVLVPRLRAQEFFTVVAKIFNREDIKIKVVTTWNEVKDLVVGENLLKNPGFEDELLYWERVMNQPLEPGLVELTEDCSFASGKRCLLIDTSVLDGRNFNLVDIAQLVRLDVNQEYIFGGIVKLDDFKEGLRFEIAQRNGFQEGYWRTDIKSGNNNWQVLFNSFSLSNKNQREVFFYAARASNLIRGKAYIDGVFIYKIKKPILSYD